MNEIFKEFWNLNAKQTFLLVAFIIELLFLIYTFFVYYYEKNETLKLIAFIKKYISFSFIINNSSRVTFTCFYIKRYFFIRWMA